MRATRGFATLLVCLGLGLPSAHGIALCVDGSGGVTVEAAVNGACVGTQVPCCEGWAASEVELGMRGPTGDHCGDCRDVVLSGGGCEPPLAAGSKAKRQPRRDAGGPIYEKASSPDDATCISERRTASPLAGPSLPFFRTVVLRL